MIMVMFKANLFVLDGEKRRIETALSWQNRVVSMASKVGWWCINGRFLFNETRGYTNDAD